MHQVIGCGRVGSRSNAGKKQRHDGVETRKHKCCSDGQRGADYLAERNSYNERAPLPESGNGQLVPEKKTD